MYFCPSSTHLPVAVQSDLVSKLIWGSSHVAGQVAGPYLHIAKPAGVHVAEPSLQATGRLAVQLGSILLVSASTLQLAMPAGAQVPIP
jgi:hypothetical protein